MPLVFSSVLRVYRQINTHWVAWVKFNTLLKIMVEEWNAEVFQLYSSWVSDCLTWLFLPPVALKS